MLLNQNKNLEDIKLAHFSRSCIFESKLFHCKNVHMYLSHDMCKISATDKLSL